MAKKYVKDFNLNIYTNIDSYVFSTDKPVLMPYRSTIYKAVLASLSDIYIKGLYPLSVGISIGLKIVRRYILREFKFGLDRVFKKYGVNGCYKWDTNYTKDPFISVFTVSLGSKELPLWSKASPGMYVYVDGYFGLTRLGLDFLMGIKNPLDFIDIYDEAINEFLYPSPNLNLYPSIVNDLGVIASIDSSDGLARSLNTISSMSNVKIVVDNIPAHKKLLNLFDDQDDIKRLIKYVFYGGEEYRGIFICDKIDERSLKKYGLVRIGRIYEGSGVYVKYNGKFIRIEPTGYIHTFD
ncbi:MAG TPA: hypothetical protein EYH44_03425 [Thermoprotei archaeon]|nr:hypothetical protein [Thermoprotei archaeon]